MGSAISALSTEQISSIPDEILFQCISIFGAVNDYNSDSIKQVSQKYIQVRLNLIEHFPIVNF